MTSHACMKYLACMQISADPVLLVDDWRPKAAMSAYSRHFIIGSCHCVLSKQRVRLCTSAFIVPVSWPLLVSLGEAFGSTRKSCLHTLPAGPAIDGTPDWALRLHSF